MVKAPLVFTCSCNVFCSQSHEEYTSHVEADLCRLKLNVTARVGVSPLTALIPPKLIAGNWKRATHATMTPQKLFLATPKGHPNQVWQICNNDNDMSDLQKLNPAKLPLPPSLIFMNAEQTLYNIAKLR